MPRVSPRIGLESGRARPTTLPPFPGKIRPKFPGVGPLSDPEVAAERLAGVFWLSFADAATVPAEVAACGRRLAGPEFDEWTLEQQVRWVEDVWQEPIVRLLVFDNCEEPALLERWRPSTGGCRVLVTSRRSSWDLAFGVQSLRVGPMPRAESLELCGAFVPI